MSPSTGESKTTGSSVACNEAVINPVSHKQQEAKRRNYSMDINLGDEICVDSHLLFSVFCVFMRAAPIHFPIPLLE